MALRITHFHPTRLRALLLFGGVLSVLLAGWTLISGIVPRSAARPDAAAEPPPWPDELYNPSPAPGDLLVPLPCGGALALRALPTPAGSVRSRVVGSLVLDERIGPVLPIGKYEVSADQFNVVSAAAEGRPCPLPHADGRRAKVRVSRIDAEQFAARWSVWLARQGAAIPDCGVGHAGVCLPRVQGEPVFVRLPLAAEWEYAARGGDGVLAAAYAAPRYPMPEGLVRHAWYRDNANGEIRPIGLRLPNPAGLHDIYGNAWELLGEHYRSGHFPDQVGGDTARGGGIHSSAGELRADYGIELVPFDADGQVATGDTGFRVVLAAPVIRSAGQARAASSASLDAPPPVTAGETPVVPPPLLLPRQGGLPEAVRERGLQAPGTRPSLRHLEVAVDASAEVSIDGVPQGELRPGKPLLRYNLPGRSVVVVASTAAGSIRKTIKLDDTGWTRVRLSPPAAEQAVEPAVRLTEAERRGVQEALRWLGYSASPPNGSFDEATRAALGQFQREHGLRATGILDEPTRAALHHRLDQVRSREAEATLRRLQEQHSARYRTSPLPVDRSRALPDDW
jgi:hypothetical protein